MKRLPNNGGKGGVGQTRLPPTLAVKAWDDPFAAAADTKGIDDHIRHLDNGGFVAVCGSLRHMMMNNNIFQLRRQLPFF